MKIMEFVKFLRFRLDNCEKASFFFSSNLERKKKILLEALTFNDIITLVPDLDYGFELRHIFISRKGYAISKN